MRLMPDYLVISSATMGSSVPRKLTVDSSIEKIAHYLINQSIISSSNR